MHKPSKCNESAPPQLRIGWTGLLKSYSHVRHCLIQCDRLLRRPIAKPPFAVPPLPHPQVAALQEAVSDSAWLRQYNADTGRYKVGGAGGWERRPGRVGVRGGQVGGTHGLRVRARTQREVRGALHVHYCLAM